MQFAVPWTKTVGYDCSRALVQGDSILCIFCPFIPVERKLMASSYAFADMESQEYVSASKHASNANVLEAASPVYLSQCKRNVHVMIKSRALKHKKNSCNYLNKNAFATVYVLLYI